jgi:hypothetical protein
MAMMIVGFASLASWHTAEVKAEIDGRVISCRAQVETAFGRLFFVCNVFQFGSLKCARCFMRPAHDDLRSPTSSSPRKLLRGDAAPCPRLTSREPNWKQRWLKKPQERLRELHGAEADGVADATPRRPPTILDFGSVSGLRLN